MALCQTKFIQNLGKILKISVCGQFRIVCCKWININRERVRSKWYIELNYLNLYWIKKRMVERERERREMNWKKIIQYYLRFDQKKDLFWKSETAKENAIFFQSFKSHNEWRKRERKKERSTQQPLGWAYQVFFSLGHFRPAFSSQHLARKVT